MALKHNVYFDGSVQSLGVPSTPRATVGVMEPGSYEFTAADEEQIHVLEGVLRISLDGEVWAEYSSGEVCVIPAGTTFKFDPHVHVAYICYYFPKEKN